MSILKTVIYRGSLIESYHNIKCYIGSLKGDKIFSTNDENDFIYPRSSIKIFQGIPFSESKAINLYNLNRKQIYWPSIRSLVSSSNGIIVASTKRRILSWS